MSAMSKRERIERWAIAQYGTEAQQWMVIEEMSELAKEICKIRRGKQEFHHLAEEIADVSIMLDQLQYMFELESEVKNQIRWKINRLANRLKEEESKQDGHDKVY